MKAKRFKWHGIEPSKLERTCGSMMFCQAADPIERPNQVERKPL